MSLENILMHNIRILEDEMYILLIMPIIMEVDQKKN